jgi:hypothetical protein
MLKAPPVDLRASVSCRAVRSKRQGLTYIGKESNRLDEVNERLVHELAAVLNEYGDPSIDSWRTHVLPVLLGPP